MSNGYLLLFGVVCALAALFWGVLAQANHVVRWWVAAGAFAVVAVALLLAAALQSGSLTLGALGP